ncbi:PREDICTED: uncharacterized protein LOC108772394 [Cyphomyrmex costatus]|uniref:uncharacterized protein LOC108772394 n=1 Tax=Cyphomyrmex costatus TaxID=456900 RepID=UPI0008522F10|nr:PREDICTED: uncharacterized protein LOC108772394 [Cyphomyrmex costatus]
MRMQLLKIVVILLVAGSGDTRPHNGADSQAKTIERNDAGWRSIQVSSKSHDIVRDDSRYTGTSGSNRKYITHFRDNADSSREHGAVNSRASNFGAARSLSVRRSKIDDIWTMPKFKAINAPPYFSRTDVLGDIAKIATVQNSNEVNKPSFHASSGDSKIIQNERIDWTKFSPDLKVGQMDYSGKTNAGNLERSKSDVISNENLEPVVAQTKYSYSAGNDFLATHASGFERTNDDISVAVENRRQSSSVRFDSFANKDIEGEMSRWKQGVNRFSLETARTNVPSDSQADASPRSIHKNRNSIRKITNSIVISYGNSKPSVVTNSSRPMSGNQHGDLNNSETSAHGAVAALISNSKSEVVGQSPAFRRRSATTSHRNFVKLRYPYSTSNWRNASNVALNMEVKNGNDISTGIQLRKPTKYFTRTGAKKPVIVNNHVMSKPMKSNHSLSVQESPSQKVGSGNKTGYKYNDTTVQYLKNWPNEALQNMEDLYNYEKYTSSLEEESSHESSLSSAEETPILSSNNYFDHTDPILDSSVKKIIHWLKIPEIVPNNTQYFDYNDDKPIQPDFESVYENLEPNRPLNTHDDNYETIVLQDAPPSQNLDTIDSNYPIRLSDPSSLQYETGSSNPFVPSIPSSWSDGTSLQNKTVYNPTTHVTQNTVVHILNDGLKKPNVTVTELKAPETDEAAANQVASSESSSESLGPSAQRPNVHIMSTSQKDENKNISKQETDTSPSSTYNTNCPTIMINTYTRVNNTLQSKEGCTDLNIIVNSHILNTNVFKPSSTPAIADDHETSLATQSYGTADESEKYSNVPTDLSYVDSVGSYASTGTYDSSLLETSQPGQHDYYDFPKDPNEILDPAQSLGLSTIDSLHTVEVSQGTQISLSLANAEETPSPAGSSVDGPGNDASSSAINPPAAGASASGPSVAGTLGSENPSVPVAQELPVYLVKPGPVTGQSNSGFGSGTLQLSALPNLPSQLGSVTKPDLSSSAGSSLSPASGSSGASPDDDDDDDFDFDFDMSPSDVLQYMAKAFTYFSFLNPLGYGVFSLTSAPFVAMAAGVLGIAAFIFPWALPSVFDFGRSADKTVDFAPNLEDFVRQAVHNGQVNDTHRDLKDLQYMDQSLRTVATQLLNVTNPQDMVNVNNKELIKAEHNIATTPKSSENSIPLLMRDVSSEINLEPMHFGRPINSKFSYFESGHPGQAMAMTEEELEREMSTTRLITAYKNHPTTTGGISTWILLNPPSTTVKSVETEKSKTQQPFQTEVRLTVRPSSSIEKETIPQPEKITEKTTPQLTPVITTEKVTVITKKPTTTTTKKIATTSKPEKVTQNSEKTETLSSTTLKVIRTTTTSTSTTSDGTATLTTVLTTKKSQPPRTTSKPKITTPRTTLHSKPATTKPTTTKPMRPKPTRKPTVKPETVKNETSASTGKIEKVTFKPVPIIATPQNKAENTEKPMFVTKIKASVLMDTQKTPITLLPATTATTLSTSTTFKSNLSTVDLVEVPVRSKPVNTKGNNVLRVQLKKPIDETTQIEIEPIKVNAPILTIEKIDKMDEIVMKDTDDLNDSRIDLKFDFNPELTKINVETKTETDAISTSTAASTTTKRPRHNSKRKKNKTRRRKPTTSAPSSTMIPVLIETIDSVTDSTIADNAVQESKIAPETKVGANTTKTKKKQPQKAISTQIYNFLSREVMPSFGVMSLVGLGLGLASYFLYPFGGTITRRNYDVEPNYKYNMDEYGGNYGQSEEEMLSKVFQGMTNVPGYENKYPGTKDNYNNNYYHYQHYDGAYDTQTKKIETRYPSISTSPVYKTVENTQPAVKYRNTDFQYPETQTTPVYYDRKRPDFAAEVGASSAANRQFVVGNVPKEYPFDVKTANLPVDSKKGYMSTEVGQTQFEREVTQNFDFPNAAGLHSYGHLGASTIRADDGYEEIEITPTAVAVEHGPRSLKVKRAALNKGNQGRHSRSKRESVIQIIPTKRELEEEREEAEKEEDLSNEILDIIDSALPGGGVPHKTKGSSENEVEDLEGQRRKQQEEANTRAKESTTKTTHTEDITEIPATSTTVGKMDDGGTSVSSEKPSDKDTTHPAGSKDPETIEWFDSSTTKKPSEGFSLINFVKKVAEIKFRLGLTILKHASEGFARYLGHVQKRINGEE